MLVSGGQCPKPEEQEEEEEEAQIKVGRGIFRSRWIPRSAMPFYCGHGMAWHGMVWYGMVWSYSCSIQTTHALFSGFPIQRRQDTRTQFSLPVKASEKSSPATVRPPTSNYGCISASTSSRALNENLYCSRASPVCPTATDTLWLNSSRSKAHIPHRRS